MPDDILKLPIAIQIALGSGFMAYMVAYAGIRQHHSTTDLAFRSISFGLVATAVLNWAPPYPVWRPLAAVSATVAFGAFWRWKGMLLVQQLLRVMRISWSDDIPSAWLSVTALRTDTYISQISVELDNGRLLTCDNARLFKDSPSGPCTFGLDGGVAMYVTAERRPEGVWIENSDVRDAFDGDRLTYVPAAFVKRVELRYWTSTTGLAEAVAERRQDAAAQPAASAVGSNPARG